MPLDPFAISTFSLLLKVISRDCDNAKSLFQMADRQSNVQTELVAECYHYSPEKVQTSNLLPHYLARKKLSI